MNTPHFYILIGAAELAAARAHGALPIPDPREGFIHASPADQLTRVANKYYREVLELTLLTIDPARVRAPIRYEAATGGLYPHIYGELNMDAIVRERRVERAADGEYSIDPATI